MATTELIDIELLQEEFVENQMFVGGLSNILSCIIPWNRTESLYFPFGMLDVTPMVFRTCWRK